jgi:hypothetical protein
MLVLRYAISYFHNLHSYLVDILSVCVEGFIVLLFGHSNLFSYLDNMHSVNFSVSGLNSSPKIVCQVYWSYGFKNVEV